MPDHTFKAKLLLEEYKRMCAEIRAVESNNEKAIAFGLSLITAAFAIGLAQHVHQIFFLIPFGIMGVFFYAVLLYTYVYSMGGYKTHLEDELNALAHERVLVWEPLVRYRAQGHIARPILVAIYLLIASILIVVSIVQLDNFYGIWPAYETMLLTLVFLALLILAYRHMMATQARIFDRARDLSKKPIEKVDGSE